MIAKSTHICGVCPPTANFQPCHCPHDSYWSHAHGKNFERFGTKIMHRYDHHSAGLQALVALQRPHRLCCSTQQQQPPLQLVAVVPVHQTVGTGNTTTRYPPEATTQPLYSRGIVGITSSASPARTDRMGVAWCAGGAAPGLPATCLWPPPACRRSSAHSEPSTRAPQSRPQP